MDPTTSSVLAPLVLTVATGAALVAVSAAVAAAVWARRSWPISMRRELDDQAERVRAVEAKWTRAAAELATLAEEVEGMLEAVERKRRRAAASASAAHARDQGELALPADPAARREAITQLARAKGFRV